MVCIKLAKSLEAGGRQLEYVDCVYVQLQTGVVFFNGFGVNVMSNSGMGFYLIQTDGDFQQNLISHNDIFELSTEGARVSYMDSASSHEVMNIPNYIIAFSLSSKEIRAFYCQCTLADILTSTSKNL